MANRMAHFFLGSLIWLLFLGYYAYTNGIVDSTALTPILVVSFFIAFLGGLLPDIDTAKSKIGVTVHFAVLLSAFSLSLAHFSKGAEVSLTAFSPILLNTLITTICLFVIFILVRPRHRELTHSVRASIVYSLLIFLWLFLTYGLQFAAFFGMLGFFSYFSHVVLDGSVHF